LEEALEEEEKEGTSRVALALALEEQELDCVKEGEAV